MGRISALDARRIDEAAAELSTLRPGQRPGLAVAVSTLEALLPGAEAIGQVIAPTGYGTELSELVGSRLTLSRVKPFYDSVAKSNAGRVGHYNPFCPEARQRNRALTREQASGFDAGKRAPIRDHYRALDLPEEGEMRVLVCEDSTLLAWFGAFRDTKFLSADLARLNKLVSPLRRRLVMERLVDAGTLLERGLEAALEAISGAAFLVNARGGIVHANAAAREVLTSDSDMHVRLRQVVRGENDFGLEVTKLCSAGHGTWWLVVARDASAQRQFQAAGVAHRWGLTPAQVRVLTFLVTGHSNRAIAGHLQRSEKTIEQHVSRILERAGCESRAELVAKVWRVSA